MFLFACHYWQVAAEQDDAPAAEQGLMQRHPDDE